MNCSNCGKELKDTDKFCSKCGAKIYSKTDKNSALVDAIQNNDLKASSEEIIDKSENTKRFVKDAVILMSIIISVVLIFIIVVKIIPESYVKNNEFLIAGTWEIDNQNVKDETFKDIKYLSLHNDGSGEITTIYGETLIASCWSIDVEYENGNILKPKKSLYVSTNLDKFKHYETYIDCLYCYLDLKNNSFSLVNLNSEEYEDIPITFTRISHFNNNYGFLSSLFKSDEKLIVGTWKLNTSSYGEGLDKLSNLNGVITRIEFYSDGTCTVDGVSSPESGVWSIVEDQLKIQGTTGGMFWNYHGFVSYYTLYGDTLTIHDDDGDNYVYYRE